MSETTETKDTKTSHVVHDLSQLNPEKMQQPKKKRQRYFDKQKKDGKPAFKPSKVSKKKSGQDRKAGKFDKSKKAWKFKRMSEENKKDETKPFREEFDPFPGRKPVDQKVVKKYMRGQPIKGRVKSEFHSKMMKKNKAKVSLAAEQAARAELLLVEEGGFLEAEGDEETADLTQHDLVNCVDITSASKHFDLKLNDFGPYRLNYTRNGRFLLIGGRKGHVAAIDWMTKKLMCEINVMEKVNDIQWLHQETMFAVAQKAWTYIYDNQGIELHCLKHLDKIQRMEFLPYHFLLAAASSSGFLQYIDISVGKKVACYNTLMGRLDVMCQNPSNAIVAMGHNAGVVTMWSPNNKEPVVKMLTHRSAVRSVAIDKTGTYLATSGIDRHIKIWDLRTYKMLQSYKVASGAGTLAFSHRGLLAAGTENLVEVYKDCCLNTITSPYMTHRADSSIQNLEFCPFEDVLGVGHSGGFQSILIPGAGEANFDALELNPYQSKNHRRQAEVKMLLEKIPYELINLDTNMVGKVDRKTVQEKLDAKVKEQIGAIDKVSFQPKFKQRGKSKGDKLVKRQKKVEEIHKQRIIQEKLHGKRIAQTNSSGQKGGPKNVLDRFKKRKD